MVHFCICFNALLTAIRVSYFGQKKNLKQRQIINIGKKNVTILTFTIFRCSVNYRKSNSLPVYWLSKTFYLVLWLEKTHDDIYWFCKYFKYKIFEKSQFCKISLIFFQKYIYIYWFDILKTAVTDFIKDLVKL